MEDAYQPKKQRSVARRVVRILVWGVGILVLLIVLAVGGALVWLRTSSAENFIASKVTEILAGQGLRMELGSLTGPLPQNLVLTDLTLYDDQGKLAHVNRLTLRLNLWSLFRAEAHVQELSLDGPELFRLPQTAQTEEQPAASGGFALPVDVALDELRIADGLLMPFWLPAAPGQTVPGLAVSAQGSAGLQRGTLKADLAASLLHTDGSGFTARIGLGAAATMLGGAHEEGASPMPDGDTLHVDIRATEGADGLIALVLGNPDFPSYNLSLQGSGPVRKWKGVLSLDAALREPAQNTDGSGQNNLASAQAEIDLECPTGSLWADLVENRQINARLQTSVTPGSQFPENILPLLSGGVTLDTALSLIGDSLSASADATSDLWMVRIADISLKENTAPWQDSSGTPHTSGMRLTGDVEISAADVPALKEALAPSQPAQNEAAPFPVRTLSVFSNLDVYLGENVTGAALQGGILASTDRALELELTLRGEMISSPSQLESGQTEQSASPDIRLQQLTLTGLGLDLQASGLLEGASGAAQAELDLHARDMGEWQYVIARFAGLLPEEGVLTALPPETTVADKAMYAGTYASGLPLGGDLTLHANFSLPSRDDRGDTAMSGTLELQGQQMRWPSAMLNTALGKTVQLSATATSGSASPYTVVLNELRARSVYLSGRADFDPAGAPAAPASSTTAATAAAATIRANLKGTITNVGLFTGADSGISGMVNANVDADGPLDRLHVRASVSSLALNIPSGTITNLGLNVNGQMQQTPESLNLTGTLQTLAGNSPGGPITLSSTWQARIPSGDASVRNEAIQAEARDLLLRGAGLEVAGEVRATLPTGANPAINGTLQARVDDWAKLAALTGAPLRGESAALDLTLQNSGGRQDASLTMALPDFRLQEPGADATVSIQNLQGSASAQDILGALTLNADLSTGRGSAGPLSWNVGEIRATGSTGKGEFLVSLRQERGAGRTRGNATAVGRTGRNASRTANGTAATQASGNERLHVAGVYDLQRSEVVLNSFSMRQPRRKAGITLQQPLTIAFGKGLNVRGADLAFEPSGRLTADAAFAPGSLAVTAALDDLSFDFIKLFSNAAIPAGRIQARVDFRSSQGRPSGSFSVLSRVSATQSVSGIVPLESAVGEGAAPATPAAETSVAAAASGDAPVFELQLNGNLGANGPRSAPGIIWLQGNGLLGSANKAEKEGTLNFALPMRAAANGIPLPDAAAPFTASLNWLGPIETLWQVVPLPDRFLSGPAKIDLKVDGSLNAPNVLVNAYLAKGHFADLVNGISISNIDLEAHNTPEGNVRALVRADDRRAPTAGTFALEAALTGLRSANTDTTLAVRGQLERFHPLQRDDLDISLSGIFGVNGPLTNMMVTANIMVDDGEFLLSNQLGGSVTTIDVVQRRSDGHFSPEDQAILDASAPVFSRAARHNAGGQRVIVQQGAAEPDEDAAVLQPGNAMELDVQVTVPSQFYIRGMGLDSEWQGDIRVTGSGTAPAVTGALRPVRGYLDLFSRTFALSGGEIIFNGSTSINPLLSLELTYEGPDITAYVRTSGTAKRPKLSLESQPPLPQDEVLSRVLFGKRASELSRFEAIQLANNLRQLTGFGGDTMDLLSSVRRTTGLDMLRLGSSQGEAQRGTSGLAGESNLTGVGSGEDLDGAGPTLEAGKYINDSIYVGVEQGVTDESTAVRVEIELYPKVNLQGKSSSNASEVGIGWKKDY